MCSKVGAHALAGNLQGTPALVAQILYGNGFRLMESLYLGIKDVDFEKNSIVVRDGKGDKDRITMLPESLKVSLQAQLTNSLALHQKGLSDGWGRVDLPDALARKYVNAVKEWGWQWVSPPPQSKSPASSRLSPSGSAARRGFLLLSTLQLTASALSRPWEPCCSNSSLLLPN